MVPTFQVPMEVSADKNFQRLSHALCVFYVINYDCNPLFISKVMPLYNVTLIAMRY